MNKEEYESHEKLKDNLAAALTLLIEHKIVNKHIVSQCIKRGGDYLYDYLNSIFKNMNK